MKYVYISPDNGQLSTRIASHLSQHGYTPAIQPIVKQSLEELFASWGSDFAGAIFVAPQPIRASIEGATDAQWAQARDGFAAPALTLTQAACGALASHGRGSMVYLNSIHAEKPLGEGFLYSTACAAVQMLCREAAIHYGKQGVGCYNVLRGIVEGEQGLLASDYSPIHHSPEARFPMGRVPNAESLFGLIEFLLTPGAYALNGSDLHADEGFRLYYGDIRR